MARREFTSYMMNDLKPILESFEVMHTMEANLKPVGNSCPKGGGSAKLRHPPWPKTVGELCTLLVIEEKARKAQQQGQPQLYIAVEDKKDQRRIQSSQSALFRGKNPDFKKNVGCFQCGNLEISNEIAGPRRRK
ncbi:hypothetical protein AMTR_s00009p00267290 [Amborella trichopoda]|uniref:Uncharacterized protein n=1 Tax=Amborella trichopoda TaxID=13333 RepID=W1NIE6_AMBTC|nr:hypothetical protein AMTR_s00009p00267290 [Amborella trichopoda]